MYRHIHQTKLSIVLHFFLSIECHLCVGIHTRCIYKIASLHKHTSRATSRVKHYALFRLQHIYQHFHQGLWRKENAIIAGYRLGKLGKEVFIDASNNIAPYFIDGLVIENSK